MRSGPDGDGSGLQSRHSGFDSSPECHLIAARDAPGDYLR